MIPGRIGYSTRQILELQRYSIARQLAQRDWYGPDDYPDGTIIKFRKRFGNSTWYRYAAIKAKGLWYTTGPRSPKGYTWDELTAWLGDPENIRKLKVATGWRSLVPQDEKGGDRVPVKIPYNDGENYDDYRAAMGEGQSWPEPG